MNYKQDFLNEQIITYLGNKRKLIPFIDKTITDLIASDEKLKLKDIKNITFFDIFSGSGIVARYAKVKGFKVLTNDLEIYSKIINSSLLNTTPEKAQKIFKRVIFNINKELNLELPINGDCYQIILDFLNSLKKPINEQSLYFSKHYAPKDTINFDFETERLFYTQENALKIDAIVEIIFNNNVFCEETKNIILSSLMYIMTKHINTSGTMKGFHNGWGGPTKTSLNRILAEFKIQKLPLLNTKNYVRVYQDYAEKIFENNKIPKVDIIYADPPYNQHQYSANYNHLVTICNNDKYNPGIVKKGSRAGIRLDHNRSDFCRSTKNKNNIKYAEQAFINFVNSIKCSYLVVSYNNEGILNTEKLLNILSNNLKNTIYVNKQIYSKFKGGQNSNIINNVIEYLFVVKINIPQSIENFDLLKKEILHNEIKHLFLHKYINYSRISNNLNYSIKGDKVYIYKNKNVILILNKFSYKVISENIELLSFDDIQHLKLMEFDSYGLIEQYIKDNNYIMAEKLLSSFNVRKLKKIKQLYINLINDIKFNQQEG